MNPADHQAPEQTQSSGVGHWATFFYGIVLGFGMALLALQFGLLGSH